MGLMQALELLLLVLLGIAGYQDWKNGEISERLNITLLLLLPLALMKCLLLHEWLSVILMLGFFALWYFGLLGGADAKLLMLLSALAGVKTALIAFAGAYLLGYSVSQLSIAGKLWLLLPFSLAYLAFGEIALLLPAIAAFQLAVVQRRFSYLPYLLLCYLLSLLRGVLP